jgi:hypothetical protein
MLTDMPASMPSGVYEEPGPDYPLRCGICAERRPATRVVASGIIGIWPACEVCASGRGPARSLAKSIKDVWVIRLVKISTEERSGDA